MKNLNLDVYKRQHTHSFNMYKASFNTYTASFLATSWDGAVTYAILCNPAVIFAATEDALQVSAIIGFRSGNTATVQRDESIMKLLITLNNIGICVHKRNKSITIYTTVIIR